MRSQKRPHFLAAVSLWPLMNGRDLDLIVHSSYACEPQYECAQFQKCMMEAMVIFFGLWNGVSLVRPSVEQFYLQIVEGSTIHTDGSTLLLPLLLLLLLLAGRLYIC